jgi:hypothetical protein
VLGRRHCDKRHRRLSAWDSRRGREGELRPGDQSLGRTEPQQRLRDEHADGTHLVNYQMEAQPPLLSREAQTEGQKTSATYGSGDRKAPTFCARTPRQLASACNSDLVQIALNHHTSASMHLSFLPSLTTLKIQAIKPMHHVAATSTSIQLIWPPKSRRHRVVCFPQILARLDFSSHVSFTTVVQVRIFLEAIRHVLF